MIKNYLEPTKRNLSALYVIKLVPYFFDLPISIGMLINALVIVLAYNARKQLLQYKDQNSILMQHYSLLSITILKYLKLIIPISILGIITEIIDSSTTQPVVKYICSASYTLTVLTVGPMIIYYNCRIVIGFIKLCRRWKEIPCTSLPIESSNLIS
jgi:uncharacterized membrane protein